VIRFTHILIAMGLILLGGVLGAKHLEDRMGVSAVPGLVLLDCPQLGAFSLEEMGARWVGSTLEHVPVESGAFRPFDADFVTRHVQQGDASALFSTSTLDRDDVDVATWNVVLEGFPGAGPEQRADDLTEVVVGFMGNRSGSRPFLVGVALERGLTEQAVSKVVDRLLAAARSYPGSRRTALVVLGADSPGALPGQLNRRWCLRIPVGDWSRRQQADLRDLLETAKPSALKGTR